MIPFGSGAALRPRRTLVLVTSRSIQARCAAGTSLWSRNCALGMEPPAAAWERSGRRAADVAEICERLCEEGLAEEVGRAVSRSVLPCRLSWMRLIKPLEDRAADVHPTSLGADAGLARQVYTDFSIAHKQADKQDKTRPCSSLASGMALLRR